MSQIRQRGNTSTERTFAALLRSSQISGWRRHTLEVVGKPDFYFPKRKVAIFVDGCFWHGCPKCFQAPKQNATFWSLKISQNQRRDGKVTYSLRKKGIRVIRIWEHDLERKTARVWSILKALRLENNVTMQNNMTV